MILSRSSECDNDTSKSIFANDSNDLKLNESDILTTDEEHRLLIETPTPGYSSEVIRRSLYMWNLLEHVVEFKTICDYYYRLDCLESTYTPELQKYSRAPEASRDPFYANKNDSIIDIKLINEMKATTITEISNQHATSNIPTTFISSTQYPVLPYYPIYYTKPLITNTNQITGNLKTNVKQYYFTNIDSIRYCNGDEYIMSSSLLPVNEISQPIIISDNELSPILSNSLNRSIETNWTSCVEKNI